MKIAARSILLAVLMIAIVPVRGEQDLPPVDAARMLQVVGELEQKRSAAQTASKKRTVDLLKSAAADGPSAVKLYSDAWEATRPGDQGSDARSVADWKKRNAELLRSREMQEALQFCLRYLALSVQRGDSDDAEAFAMPSLAYARDLAGFLAELRGPKEVTDLLHTPGAQTIFARWLELGPWLPPAEDWEPAAGNLDGILEKNVRGPWRAAAKPELLETWDFQLKHHAGRAGTEGAAGEFNTVRRPRMIFGRALDAASLGLTNRAAQDIFELARQHPDHPDFGEWVGKIRGLLEGSAAPQETAQP